MLRILSAAVALLLAATPALAQHDLRYRAKKNETFHCIVKVKASITLPDYKMAMSGKSIYAFTCISERAPLELEGRIHREILDISFDIPGIGKISSKVDTKGKKPAPPENLMDFKKAIPYGLYVKHTARVGKRFITVVGLQGEIRRLRDVQEIQDGAIEKIDNDPEINPILAGGLKRDLTVGIFRQNLEGIFPTLPTKIVKPGDSWTRNLSRTLDDGSVLELREKATLGEVNEGFANIGIEIRLKQKGQEIKPESQNPLEKILSGKAERYDQDMECLVDLSTGRTVFAAGVLESVIVTEVENTITGQTLTRKAQTKLDVEMEVAPGPVKEEEESGQSEKQDKK